MKVQEYQNYIYWEIWTGFSPVKQYVTHLPFCPDLFIFNKRHQYKEGDVDSLDKRELVQWWGSALTVLIKKTHLKNQSCQSLGPGASTGCPWEHPSSLHLLSHSPQPTETRAGWLQGSCGSNSSGRHTNALVFYCWHHSDVALGVPRAILSSPQL